MANTIDNPFFFIHHLIEDLKSFRLPEKASLILAPLLPFIAFVVGLYFMYNSIWFFVLIIPLILTFLLSIGTYFFIFKGINIYIASGVLRLMLKGDFVINEFVTHSFIKKPLEIKLKKENLIVSKVKTISFSEAQYQMIMDVFNILKNEIISDESVLEDFINVIKQVSSENINYKDSIVKLELPAKECSVFLDSIFIPLVKKVTGKKLDLISIYMFFYYLKSKSYRPVNYGSITKKRSKLCKSSCEKAYNEALQVINKVG